MTRTRNSAKVLAAADSLESLGNMVFYILTPYKIDAHEHKLRDFLADDLLDAIQAAATKIATDKECLEELQKAYPKYHKYKVILGKV